MEPSGSFPTSDAIAAAFVVPAQAPPNVPRLHIPRPRRRVQKSRKALLRPALAAPIAWQPSHVPAHIARDKERRKESMDRRAAPRRRMARQEAIEAIRSARLRAVAADDPLGTAKGSQSARRPGGRSVCPPLTRLRDTEAFPAAQSRDRVTPAATRIGVPPVPALAEFSLAGHTLLSEPLPRIVLEEMGDAEQSRFDQSRNALRQRLETSQHTHVVPDSVSDILLEDWLASIVMDDLPCASRAMHALVRTKEVIAKTSHLPSPNVFTTAGLVALLPAIVPLFGPYAPLATRLFAELCQAMFIDVTLPATSLLEPSPPEELPTSERTDSEPRSAGPSPEPASTILTMARGMASLSGNSSQNFPVPAAPTRPRSLPQRGQARRNGRGGRRMQPSRNQYSGSSSLAASLPRDELARLREFQQKPATALRNTLRSAFKKKTYFSRLGPLRANIQALDAKRETFTREREWLEKETARRVTVFSRTVKHWSGGVLSAAFRAWRAVSVERHRSLKRMHALMRRVWDRKSMLLARILERWKMGIEIERMERLEAAMSSGNESIREEGSRILALRGEYDTLEERTQRGVARMTRIMELLDDTESEVQRLRAQVARIDEQSAREQWCVVTFFGQWLCQQLVLSLSATLSTACTTHACSTSPSDVFGSGDPGKLPFLPSLLGVDTSDDSSRSLPGDAMVAASIVNHAAAAVGVSLQCVLPAWDLRSGSLYAAVAEAAFAKDLRRAVEVTVTDAMHGLWSLAGWPVPGEGDNAGYGSASGNTSGQGASSDVDDAQSVRSAASRTSRTSGEAGKRRMRRNSSGVSASASSGPSASVRRAAMFARHRSLLHEAVESAVYSEPRALARSALALSSLPAGADFRGRRTFAGAHVTWASDGGIFGEERQQSMSTAASNPATPVFVEVADAVRRRGQQHTQGRDGGEHPRSGGSDPTLGDDCHRDVDGPNEDGEPGFRPVDRSDRWLPSPLLRSIGAGDWAALRRRVVLLALSFATEQQPRGKPADQPTQAASVAAPQKPETRAFGKSVGGGLHGAVSNATAAASLAGRMLAVKKAAERARHGVADDQLTREAEMGNTGVKEPPVLGITVPELTMAPSREHAALLSVLLSKLRISVLERRATATYVAAFGSSHKQMVFELPSFVGLSRSATVLRPPYRIDPGSSLTASTTGNTSDSDQPEPESVQARDLAVKARTAAATATIAGRVHSMWTQRGERLGNAREVLLAVIATLSLLGLKDLNGFPSTVGKALLFKTQKVEVTKASCDVAEHPQQRTAQSPLAGTELGRAAVENTRKQRRRGDAPARPDDSPLQVSLGELEGLRMTHTGAKRIVEAVREAMQAVHLSEKEIAEDEGVWFAAGDDVGVGNWFRLARAACPEVPRDPGVDAVVVAPGIGTSLRMMRARRQRARAGSGMSGSGRDYDREDLPPTHPIAPNTVVRRVGAAGKAWAQVYTAPAQPPIVLEEGAAISSETHSEDHEMRSTTDDQADAPSPHLLTDHLPPAVRTARAPSTPHVDSSLVWTWSESADAMSSPIPSRALNRADDRGGSVDTGRRRFSTLSRNRIADVLQAEVAAVPGATAGIVYEEVHDVLQTYDPVLRRAFRRSAQGGADSDASEVEEALPTEVSEQEFYRLVKGAALATKRLPLEKFRPHVDVACSTGATRDRLIAALATAAPAVEIAGGTSSRRRSTVVGLAGGNSPGNGRRRTMSRVPSMDKGQPSRARTRTTVSPPRSRARDTGTVARGAAASNRSRPEKVDHRAESTGPMQGVSGESGADLGDLLTLGPAEFVESVVRLAAARIGRKRLPLAIRLRQVLEKISQALAAGAESEHRTDLRGPAYVSLLRRYRTQLVRIFKHYAALDTSLTGATQLNTMNLAEFMCFVKDYKLLSDTFTRRDALVVFVSAQVSGPVSKDPAAAVSAGAEELEMVFSEFEEAVLTLALYVHRNPYEPFDVRARRLFQERLAAPPPM